MAGEVDVISDVIQTSDLPDTLRVVYSAELDFVARPMLIFDQFCERKNDFKGAKGTSITWTVYQNLPPSIRPLVEDQDVGGMGVADFQVNMTVQEYGTAIGTTEKLDLTSYHGPVSSLVRTMLAPQQALTVDLLARNAMMDPHKSTYRTFAGGAANRAALTLPTYDENGIMTSGHYGSAMTQAIVKAAAYNLSTRRIPPTPQGYLALCHPAQTYDLKSNPFWIDVLKYTQPDTIMNGEVGKIHGVRFVEGHNARLPNAGAQTYQTTLAGDAPTNRDWIAVVSVTGMVVGHEITIHRYSSTPDGTDETEEHLVIKSIAATAKRVYFRSKITVPHAAGDFVTEGIDVYPVIFMGGIRPVGRGAVLEPEVRVAMPTDKLRRQYHVGWYGLFGYGIIRDWAMEVVECTSGVSGAPAFPW
jgi:N4-gp56 family major capsid protein